MGEPHVLVGSGGAAAPCLYFIGARNEPAAPAALAQPRFCTVIHLSDADFFADLSPWGNEALTPDAPPFDGGAPAYARTLVNRTMPACERAFGLAPTLRAVAGYSLAGLFSLYAFLETGAFAAAASISGSLWYEGWVDYLRGALAAGLPLAAAPDRATLPEGLPYVYCTLGTKERNAPNPRMRCVRTRTEETVQLMRAAGIDAAFEKLPGMHFTFVDERIDQALRSLDARLEHAVQSEPPA